MLYEKLFKEGIAVTRYHAGLTAEERRQNQEDFIYDNKLIMIATNAFGMGIDKSNVRYVLHYNMPQSLENYYQEAGRAGRDSESANCILLYSAQEVMINRFRTLVDMCVKSPLTKAEMLNGVGERKFHRYGERFLNAIREYTGGVREKYYFGEEEDM